MFDLLLETITKKLKTINNLLLLYMYVKGLNQTKFG